MTAAVATADLGVYAWGLSCWDALIVRAAEVAGCSVLLSEDLADGATFGTLRVVNPLRIAA